MTRYGVGLPYLDAIAAVHGPAAEEVAAPLKEVPADATSPRLRPGRVGARPVTGRMRLSRGD
ncbi:hypothetical protein ACWDX6_18195 [Streptomyces sp. NPDC003027]